MSKVSYLAKTAFFGQTSDGADDDGMMHATSWRRSWHSSVVPSANKTAHVLNIPEHVTNRPTYKATKHPHFKAIVNVIILLNAVQMGIAADKRGDAWQTIWLVFDNLFTFVFAAEMVLQLHGSRLYYFYDPWNYLDFMVAIVAMVNHWILPFLFNLEDTDKSFDAFRIFRVLKLLRMLKIMRVIPELAVVIEGIIASLKSMFWIFVLLAIVIYTAGIFCVETIGQASIDDFPARSDYQRNITKAFAESFNNYAYFGTVTRSMLSLFNVVLLDEWGTIVRPVYELQPLMMVLFIALVIVCSFGILNVIIGVVVERTTSAMNAVQEHHIEQLKLRQACQVKRLAKVMFDLDEDSNRRVTLDELERGKDHEHLQEMLSTIDFPLGFTFSDLFEMLDVDGNDSLSMAEFVDGVMRLMYTTDFQRDCLHARAFGQLRHTHKLMKAEFRAFTKDIKKDIEALKVECRSILEKASARQVDSVVAQASPIFRVPGISTSEGSVAGDAANEDKNAAPNTPGNPAMKFTTGVEAASIEVGPFSDPTWEPLEMASVPLKLLKVCPQSSRSSPNEVAASLTRVVAEFSRQGVLGFLPIAQSTTRWTEL